MEVPRGTKSKITRWHKTASLGGHRNGYQPRVIRRGMSWHKFQELGGATVIGPLMVGLEKPMRIVGLGAKDGDIANMAALAGYSIGASGGPIGAAEAVR